MNTNGLAGGADDSSAAGSIRRIGATALGTVQNRLELLTVELKEERYWLVSAIVLASCAVVLGLLALVALVITVTWLAPADARAWLLPGICGVFLAGFAWASFALKRSLQRPAPLEKTLAELRKDIECLKL
jgi:uncharacterized membrane protein YqjE